ncbi:hypothetical protein T09_4939, partial [Trichinella sp. T9]
LVALRLRVRGAIGVLASVMVKVQRLLRCSRVC